MPGRFSYAFRISGQPVTSRSRSASAMPIRASAPGRSSAVRPSVSRFGRLSCRGAGPDRSRRRS
jgi:hypothetical protein